MSVDPVVTMGSNGFINLVPRWFFGLQHYKSKSKIKSTEQQQTNLKNPQQQNKVQMISSNINLTKNIIDKMV